MRLLKKPRMSLQTLLALVALGAALTCALQAWHRSAVQRFESAMRREKHQEAFDLAQQARWFLPWDTGWARRHADAGFRFAQDRFMSLGGRTAPSIHDALLVYFWDHIRPGTRTYVEDIEGAIWCLRRFHNVSDIFLDERSWQMRERLQREFPDVKIHKQNAGII